MSIEEVKKLREGDTVYWNDPDDGACSRMITVQTVAVQLDTVFITGKDGYKLVCLAEELT